MHPALCFGCRHALHAVHSRFIFQNAVYAVAAYGEVDFLVSAYRSLAYACHGDVPSLGFAESLIHGKEVSGKESRLVAAGTGTDFHLHVLGVFRVFRHEGHLYLLLNLWLHLLVGLQFLPCHLLQVGVALVCEDVLCLLDGVQAVDVSLAGVHDVAQVPVFLCQFNISLLVGDYVRVGDECRHFFVSAFKTIQLL